MDRAELSAREEFAQYLESANPGGNGLAHDATWSGQITVGPTTRYDIRRLLGSPDESTSTTLAYALPQRDGYRYCFDFHPEHDVLVDHGYRRAGASALPPDQGLAWASLVRELAALGATREEVRAWIGDPESTSGWWPIETWEYPGGRVITFRHGIVMRQALNTSESAV